MNANHAVTEPPAAQAEKTQQGEDATPEEAVSEETETPSEESISAAAASAESVSADSISAEPTSPEAAPTEPAPGRPGSEPSAGTNREPAAVPEQRTAAEADSKAKKPRRAVRAKSVSGTKSLVVWREGRLHYADDSVLVVDLDEAASPDTDVHDVVDRLTELRDAVESTGRTETVAALGEIIQEKALN